jgi:hypothetical protein
MRLYQFQYSMKHLIQRFVAKAPPGKGYRHLPRGHESREMIQMKQKKMLRVSPPRMAAGQASTGKSGKRSESSHPSCRTSFFINNQIKPNMRRKIP